MSNIKNLRKRREDIGGLQMSKPGGGFEYFLFSSLFGGRFPI